MVYAVGVVHNQKVIGKKYQVLSHCLDERALRLWAAAEAQSLGRGGVSAVARATRLSRTTIHAGMKELVVSRGAVRTQRQRAAGGGRKRLVEKDPRLLVDLEELVEPTTRGHPESPLRWTCKSTTRLAQELNERRHRVSQRTVCQLLWELGYSLQSTRKTREGAQHPDRDAQFQHIAREVRRFQRLGEPVISVDTKKKELMGDFENKRREWHRRGCPEPVRVHDFADPELGKVAPYGVYDIGANEGWVSVGVDHDTAEFAGESIRRWWREMGSLRYPKASRLLITADGGGSNGSRVRLWKLTLQRLADELGLEISVCHFPPGTSKWNKIEHRMFCHISTNWRGRPLTSRQVVVKLIGQTTTKEGLNVRAELDTQKYEPGIKVSDEEMAALALKRDSFHGEWNYSLLVRK